MNRHGKTNFRKTPQRMAIMDCIKVNKQHPSAEDIFRIVRLKYPNISFATVYNTLELLKKRGEILELTSDPVRRRFDPDTSPHHHLICLKCSRISDLNFEITLTLTEEQKQGFDIHRTCIEFHGYCRECKTTDA